MVDDMQFWFARTLVNALIAVVLFVGVMAITFGCIAIDQWRARRGYTRDGARFKKDTLRQLRTGAWQSEFSVGYQNHPHTKLGHAVVKHMVRTGQLERRTTASGDHEVRLNPNWKL